MSTAAKTSSPIIQESNRISKVWLLPAVAVLVGLSMLFHQWQNQGTTVQITFDSGAGLEVGKTKIKYRDVDIGEVTNIAFNDDLSKVLVQIVVKKAMRELLVSDSLFWVVRARVDAGGLTGFSTLVSGVYIEIAPGSSNQFGREFVGLEAPPVTAPTVAGLHLTLTSKGGKPLKVGNPVIHQGFNVGRIEKIDFDISTGNTDYQIFIDAPYDSLVTTNSHFWNVGGASLQTTATGVTLDIASFETLLSGGIEFAVPAGLPLGNKIEPYHAFELFSSASDVEEGKKYRSIEYAILVDEAVGGLNKGAPVEFRGIRIGTVESAKIDFQKLAPSTSVANDSRIPVIIKIEPGRVVQNSDTAIANYKDQIDEWILSGLTARIEPANLLTGTLKVSLNSGGERRSTLEKNGIYTLIPWQPGAIASLSDKIESILTTVDSLPLDVTVARMNRTITDASTALSSIEDTSRQLENTLLSLQQRGELFDSLQAAIDEFEVALKTVTPLIQDVRNKPNSLIFGSQKPADKEPIVTRKRN